MTNEQYLAEAVAARHRLITGTQMVSFTGPNGRSMSYSQANLAALDAYIAELRAAIAGDSVPRRNRISYVVPL